MDEETRAAIAEVMREIMTEIMRDGGTIRATEIARTATETVVGPADPAMNPSGEKGAGAARLIRALVTGKGDPLRAASYVRRNWEDETVARALESGVDAAGGFIVPPSYTTEIIELLYPQTVIRGSGARIYPMPTGTAEIPRLAGGVQAEYLGENQNIIVDQPDFGQLNLAWKKLACIVPISNDLIRFSNPSADTIVRDDLVRSMALREDRAFIRDDGTGQKPRGLRFQAGIFTRPMTALPADDVGRIRVIRADLNALEQALEDAEVPVVNVGFIIRPRVKFFLRGLTDANGNQPFAQELDRGELNGHPVRVSTQIPGNLGAGGNETEIYFAAFPNLIIGEASELIVDASSEAAYHDGTAVQAAFSRDQSLVRAIARHDFGLRHPRAVSVLTGVTWGA